MRKREREKEKKKRERKRESVPLQVDGKNHLKSESHQSLVSLMLEPRGKKEKEKSLKSLECYSILVTKL